MGLSNDAKTVIESLKGFKGKKANLSDLVRDTGLDKVSVQAALSELHKLGVVTKQVGSAYCPHCGKDFGLETQAALTKEE